MKMQFVWWPRLQFWFVRDEHPMSLIYAWRMQVGALEIRKWRRFVRGPIVVAPHATERSEG